MLVIFERQQKIVFIGDSITDAGRRPGTAPYGDGYVSQVCTLLQARYPELRLRFANRGVAGDTSRHLADRWERDVIAEQPDWLVMMIGINDVWLSFGLYPQEAVPLPEYEATLRRLLDRTCSATSARLVLMEPYMIEPNRLVPMRRQMDWYGAVIRRLAADYGAVLVRTQAAFDTVLAHTTPHDWSGDQIHPSSAGHAIIALALLREIGFSW
jgi:lysophospholipase L1-like esterase